MIYCPPKKQSLLFSATRSEQLEEIKANHLINPEVIEIKGQKLNLPRVSIDAHFASNFNSKLILLAHLLSKGELSKTLLFSNSKKKADLIWEFLENKVACGKGALHSNKSQNFRLSLVKDFESGPMNFLVATDLAARGLDFADITHILNFDMPDSISFFVHRVGRTARFGKEGKVICFVDAFDEAFFNQLNEKLNDKIEIHEWPEDLEPSDELMPFEVQHKSLGDISYYIPTRIKHSQGAYHEKSKKNQKVNLGSAYWRKKKQGNKKAAKRSGKKR